MVWFKRSSPLTILTVVLTLGLAVNLPVKVLAQLSSSSLSSELEKAFVPPFGTGKPVNREGGGTRGPCIQGDKPLTALVPVSGVGETMAQSPTVFWYMPKISPTPQQSPVVEFVVWDANDQEVYSTRYRLPKSSDGVEGTPGVMSLTIPDVYPLKLGQEYRWQLNVRCNYMTADHSEDTFVEGRLKRVASDPNLESRIQQANPQERVALYAQANLWYEMLGTLVNLRRDRPNDPTLADAWNKLLLAIDLPKISVEPVFQGAKNISN